MVRVGTETGDDRIATMQLEFELADVSQLDEVLSSVLGVEAVYDAYRVIAGGGAETPTAG